MRKTEKRNDLNLENTFSDRLNAKVGIMTRNYIVQKFIRTKYDLKSTGNIYL